jgi:DNA-binding GntR family transcriptional regulator
VQERTDANLREIKAEIRPNNVKLEVIQGILFSRMDIHQARAQSTEEEINAKMDAKQETIDASQKRLEAKIDSHHEKLRAIMRSDKEKMEDMMEAYLENTEATNLEANPEEIESESEHQEVLKEEGAMETTEGLKDR